jgi:regulator of replication initiation timing
MKNHLMTIARLSKANKEISKINEMLLQKVSSLQIENTKLRERVNGNSKKYRTKNQK